MHSHSALLTLPTVIPACPESYFKNDSRRALLAGMTIFSDT